MSPSSRSGVNYQVFSRLSQKCTIVDLVDLDLRGLQKIYSALTHFSFNRRKWGGRLHQNAWAFVARSKNAEMILQDLANSFDVIYQDGSMFMPGMTPQQPFVTYLDCNVKLAADGGPHSHSAHYRGHSLAKAIELERRVYESSSIIFTLSDWLKNSLIKDFHISEEKIITVYAGGNLPLQSFEKQYDGKTILFVGKSFERKGGPTLLKAFRTVRQNIPESRLVIIGPTLNVNLNGVSVLGPVTDHAVLARHFREASLFVLPSLFEGSFALSFAEALAFQTPCIGTNVCAIPEIIEHGKSGYVVPPEDHEILAKRIIEILGNKTLSRDMGQYGLKKAREIFNWDVVVEKIFSQTERLVKHR